MASAFKTAVVSVLVATAMLLAICPALHGVTQPNDSEWLLNSVCPAGFELTPDNHCKLRSLYQFYDSTQNRGVGGTHTGLPPYTDGFTPQQIDLGRYLFFDPILSSSQSVSCATCHQPDKGFTDGRAQAVGVSGEPTQRSAPTLWNVAFVDRLFWDARATSYSQQAQEALYSEHEMGNTPTQVLAQLRADRNYSALFAQAFPDSQDIELGHLYSALTAFQTSLVSLNSRYDEYAHGNHTALSEKEIEGMNVFRSFVARCSECHTPPLFTNNQVAVIGTPEPAGRALDVGAERTFGAPQLRGGFKVPTLRNITKTAPYMHSGVFDNLRDATEFYNLGRGHAVPQGENMLLHWHISEPQLSDAELDLIVIFLHSLEDEKFMPEIPQQLPSGIDITQAPASREAVELASQ